MARSITDFVNQTAQDETARELFELENPHLLEVNLSGQVWAKTGSMIAYQGGVNFEREGMLEQGLGKLFKKALTGEGTSLMKVSGLGRVYLADAGKKIQILKLENEKIVVNGNDLLAMTSGLEWDIKLMRRIAGMLAGGLFNVSVEGSGMIAITTHYEPLTLRVEPGKPVFTDPNATVAWSGSLEPEIVANIDFRTLMGRGSGEAIQLKFQGSGWVVLQPYEEVYMQAKS